MLHTSRYSPQAQVEEAHQVFQAITAASGHAEK